MSSGQRSVEKKKTKEKNIKEIKKKKEGEKPFLFYFISSVYFILCLFLHIINWKKEEKGKKRKGKGKKKGKRKVVLI